MTLLLYLRRIHTDIIVKTHLPTSTYRSK